MPQVQVLSPRPQTDLYRSVFCLPKNGLTKPFSGVFCFYELMFLAHHNPIHICSKYAYDHSLSHFQNYLGIFESYFLQLETNSLKIKIIRKIKIKLNKKFYKQNNGKGNLFTLFAVLLFIQLLNCYRLFIW